MPEDLSEILRAFHDALEFWSIKIAEKNISGIPPAKALDPLQEIVKIAKLIKAHTTKVGIIFEPLKLSKQTDAAAKTVTDFLKLMVLYMSALAQVSPLEVSQLFYNEILSKSHDLTQNGLLFSNELIVLEERAKELKKTAQETDPEATLNDVPEEETKTALCDERLVSVGKLWSTTDDIVKLVESGNLKFLEKKTKLHLTLIEDGLDEFSAWAENPEDLDEEDPFGLEDEFSDDESEVPLLENDDSDNEDSGSKKDYLIQYSKSWLQKFKLLKLLFFSINKSLPTIAAGEDIDSIYREEETIYKEVDLLIVELMLNQIVDEEVREHATKIDKACFRIIGILRRANKNNETKTKWCGSWVLKYGELTESVHREE